MKILITGGGTAGHVTPLLAVASSIKKQIDESKIFYIGQAGDRHAKDFKNSILVYKSASIVAGKLRRFYGKKWYWYLSQPTILLKNIRDALYIIAGFIQSIFMLIAWRPDVVFVKGGYVGLPVGLAAGLLRIPLVTHDSDIIPGLTNRVLARFAKLQAVGMPADAYNYNKRKIRYTGVPVREDFVNHQNNNQDLPSFYSNNNPIIAIVGGSLGAVRLNNAVYSDLDYIINNSNANIFWLTGNNQFKQISKKLQKDSKKFNSRVVAEPYSNNLHSILLASQIVVSRAGATTLAELAVLKKPVILVPNPYLTAGHQIKNAQYYKEHKAAIVIAEKDLENSNVLGSTIVSLLNNPSLQAELKINIGKFAVEAAADNIVKALQEALKK